METKTINQMTGRNLLIYLAIKEKGNWNAIYNDISSRKDIESDFDTVLGSVDLASCVTLLDPEYPASLKNSYQPPFVLFTRGDISLLNSSEIEAIIGTRNPTKYGVSSIERFVDSRKKVTLVTSLSKGTSALAISKHISNGGKAILVLASGLNDELSQDLKDLMSVAITSGCVLISEYPNGVTPNSSQFISRNRIVGGISNGLAVMEFKKNSGTAITISIALGNNKDITVLPVQADSPFENNSLIKEGADILVF